MFIPEKLVHKKLHISGTQPARMFLQVLKNIHKYGMLKEEGKQEWALKVKHLMNSTESESETKQILRFSDIHTK